MTLGMATQSRIDDIVSQWVGEGKMFTAFEVSLAVKDQGIRERHRNMRDYIHESIFRAGVARGDYTRTLMDVGAPQQAWVYHPVGANPYEYEPLDRTGFDRPRVQKADRPRGVRNPSLLKTGALAPSAIPQGAYGTDQRGRLCIPVNLLSKLGAGPGQRVKVLCDPANEQVLISPSASADAGNPDTTYTIEPDGNVRITQGTLEKAGLDGLQCYRVDGTDSVITVRTFA
jgi:hypothetical protein